MKIIKSNDLKALKEASEQVKKGASIIYPTETCYGLGTNALNKKAVKKLYEIKKRDPEKPVSVIVLSIKEWNRIAYLNKPALKLIEAFMPGPLTIILKSRIKNFRKTGVACRISSNLVANKLCRLAGPLISTSANPSGRKEPYNPEELKIKADFLIDAGRLEKTRPSTIIDLRSKKPALIREGPVSFDEIIKVLRNLVISPFFKEDVNKVYSLIHYNINNVVSRFYPEEQINILRSIYKKERMNKLVNNNETKSFVLKKNHKIKGFIAFIIRKDYLHITDFFTKKTGKGYGKMLQNHVERIALTKHIPKLFVRASLNSIGFYARMGFKKIKKGKTTYGINIILMEKKLPKTN